MLRWILNNNSFHFMAVQSAKGSLSNIAVRDVSNKIGLKFISLSAQVKCLKLEILFFRVMYNVLKLRHHSSKMLMMKELLHPNKKDLKHYSKTYKRMISNLFNQRKVILVKDLMVRYNLLSIKAPASR